MPKPAKRAQPARDKQRRKLARKRAYAATAKAIERGELDTETAAEYAAEIEAGQHDDAW